MNMFILTGTGCNTTQEDRGNPHGGQGQTGDPEDRRHPRGRRGSGLLQPRPMRAIERHAIPYERGEHAKREAVFALF